MKFYSIGYGGRNPQDFVEKLIHGPDRARVGAYVKTNSPDKGIQKLLSAAGIGYISILELGNIFLECEDWEERYRRLMNNVGDMLTERLLNIPDPFCLLCAEQQARACHRQLIADHLVSKGHNVEHIE